MKIKESYPKFWNKQIECACECWFTIHGNALPKQVKYVDSNGDVQEYNRLQILHYEWKCYDEKLAIEYECMDEERNHQVLRLLFYPADCMWKILEE